MSVFPLWGIEARVQEQGMSCVCVCVYVCMEGRGITGT